MPSVQVTKNDFSCEFCPGLRGSKVKNRNLELDQETLPYTAYP